MFFNPAARSLYAGWDRAAKDGVAILRSEAGRSPHDRELSASSASSPPDTRSSAGWAAHSVRLHTKGVKQFNHPLVGGLELSSTVWSQRRPGLMIVAYTAEPGSRSAEALGLLASWAATEEVSRPAPSDPEAHQVGRDAR